MKDKIDVKIVTVIVTYNRLSLLKECIDALINSIIRPIIVVVNNNSSDGTDAYLDELHANNKDIIPFNLNENLNGAGGYNFGLNEAIKLNPDYIWLMDDDCIVNNDSLSKLLDTAYELNNNFGFLSSKVLWTDGSICKTNVQRKAVARKVKDFTSKLVNVDYTSFVSCFVRTDMARQVGLPIKEFIIWSDDLEWTRRLTNKKYNKKALPGYLCNESIVTHKCNHNKGVAIDKDTYDRASRYKYIYRNDVVCFRKEGIKGHIYMFIRNIYHIFRILLFADSNKLNRIKVLVSGYISGYSFNPEIEYSA